MTTTTFGWVPLSGETGLDTGEYLGPVTLSANADATGAFVGWNAEHSKLLGQFVGADGTPVAGDLFLANAALPYVPGSGVARLSDGRFVTAYIWAESDPAAHIDIRARIVAADGALAGDLDVAFGSFVD